MEDKIKKSLDRVKNTVTPFFENLEKMSKECQEAERVLNECHAKEGFYKCIVDTQEKQVYLLWKPVKIDDPKGKWRIFLQIDHDERTFYKVFSECKVDVRLEYYPFLEGFLESLADNVEKIYEKK